MGLTGLIMFLAIGALAGWLDENLMKGGGFGVVNNVIIGVVGSVVGGFLFSLIGFKAVGLIGSIISATVGASVLLFVIAKVNDN